MCLNETYGKTRIGKHLTGAFPIKNGPKQGDALSPLLFSFALEYASDAQPVFRVTPVCRRGHRGVPRNFHLSL
jgi:hypothetical protein